MLPTLRGAQIKYAGSKWVISGWEVKAGVEAEAVPGWGRGGAGRCCTPTWPEAVVFLSRPAAAAASTPPRSPGNKGPPPPTARRDLRGQREAGRPDADGGCGRPRVARFLQVSSPGALLGASRRFAARGEGAQQVLGGIKRCFSQPPARRQLRARRPHPVVGGGEEERHPSLGSERSAQPI